MFKKKNLLDHLEELFKENISKTITYKTLCKEIWGKNAELDYSAKNSISVHICNLRRKISKRFRIETIRGSGYKLVERGKTK